MRVVLDTNVLLSAAFTPGVCEVLLDLCLTLDDATLVSSQHIIAQFSRHAGDEFGAPPEKVEALVAWLRQRLELVQPAPVEPKTLDDRDDLPVLGTAVAGRAEVLVTGDRALLALEKFQDIAILSPRAFYELLRR